MVAATVSLYDDEVLQHDNDYFIMAMSQLVRYPSSFFQPACARLNPYGRRHHCGKEISFCIHDKSILLLGHRGAYDTDAFLDHRIY
jgi:hypothetical protein